MSEKNPYTSAGRESSRDKKLIRTKLAAALLAGLALVGCESEDLVEAGNPDNVIVVAEFGDTPWNIARNHLGEETDIRPLVAELSEQTKNDGTPSGLHPGDILELPPKSGSE
jgi:hypothetical protein